MLIIFTYKSSRIQTSQTGGQPYCDTSPYEVRKLGGSPGIVVIGDNSCSRGRGFESQRRTLDGHLLTLICCKNCIVCLKRLKINEKKSGVGPFFKKVSKYFLI